jgi:hypothetical protein
MNLWWGGKGRHLMRKTIIVTVVSAGMAALVVGCGESIPQKTLEGGIMSGTEVEQQQYAQHQNPILAGNGPQTVGPTAASMAPATPISPTPMNHAGPMGPVPASSSAPNPGQ